MKAAEGRLNKTLAQKASRVKANESILFMYINFFFHCSIGSVRLVVKYTPKCEYFFSHHFGLEKFFFVVFASFVNVATMK